MIVSSPAVPWTVRWTVREAFSAHWSGQIVVAPETAGTATTKENVATAAKNRALGGREPMSKVTMHGRAVTGTIVLHPQG